MNTCQQFRELLFDLVAGSLPAEVREAAEYHHQGCPRCRVEKEQHEFVIRMARHLPGIRPPHRLLLRFRRALEESMSDSFHDFGNPSAERRIQPPLG